MTANAFLVALALACAAGAAFAADAVPVLHGGIGEDERMDMAMQHADYNLRMTFAVKRAGNFVADVQVVVEDDARREVVRVTSDGPWLFARVAPGRYAVRATYGAVEQARAVRVPPSGAAELVFYWDDPAALEGRGMEPERARRRFR